MPEHWWHHRPAAKNGAFFLGYILCLAQDVRPDVQFKIAAQEYDDTEEQQLKLLYKAVHQLNDIEKALVFLYLEDKNYRDISETLGITEVNARVKMNRVKTKLKTILNP